jgi:hypothetical protein
MLFKEKHTGNLVAAINSLHTIKELKSILLVPVFLFTFSQVFASIQDVETVYSTGNTTIIYSASDSNKVIITEGKITAIEGKTINLLPGTHIKSSGQLTVNIASKECQDAVAIEVAKGKEKTMLASAAVRREEVLLTTSVEEIPIAFTRSQFPGQNSAVGQQNLQLAASLVNTTVSFAPQESLLNKKINLSNIHNFPVLAYQSIYTPVCSWGDRAETIKVMLC